MNKKQTGIIRSAELCTPLKGVRVLRTDSSGETLEITYSDEQGYWQLHETAPGQQITFEMEGFVPKTFDAEALPDVVRLLENRLIAYQNRLWFIPGETIEVYVHSPISYSAQLFRHGFMKECILRLGVFDAQIQKVPDEYFVETGLHWNASFSYTIPEHVEPGLYSLLLEAQGEEPFAIPMVVSTAANQYGKTTKLLFLVSTNTWQSYNFWGGRSRYRNLEDRSESEFSPPSGGYNVRRMFSKLFPLRVKTFIKHFITLPSPQPAAWQFKKLTIRRPFTNCALEEDWVFQPFTHHLAAGEWRLSAWLERERIAYDIISGMELHRNPDLLRHYKAIILSTHSEYWSRQMYAGLRHYHENHGLWVLNISGNTLFREIECFEDGSTRCASLLFGDSCADETQILGVRYTEGDDDYGTCAPYKIIQPDHWVFKNIPIGRDRLFGGLSLNQNTPKTYSRYDPGRPGIKGGLDGMGASGWETDKLSLTAPKDIKIIAKGLNPKGGADMVVREPVGKRGGMFSASSITFGGALLIDNIASSLVKNVFSRALSDEQ